MAEAKKWQFDMGQRVAMMESEEEGVVIGRSEYVNSMDNYLVRYCAGDGRQTEQWFSADSIDSAN